MEEKEEKRIKKIEKIIAGGRGKYLLRQVISRGIFIIICYLVAHLLHILGFINGNPMNIGETIFEIIVWAVITGILYGCDFWDRLVELYEKYSQPQIAPELSGLETKQ
jgi:hypothetical protein